MKSTSLLFFILLLCTSFSLKDGDCWSIRASHILLAAKSKKEFARADKDADSLIIRINQGQSFEALAKIYGSDGTKNTGGDLGWFEKGMMVEPFEYACVTARKNILFKVTTEFGVHVGKVTDRKLIPCK